MARYNRSLVANSRTHSQVRRTRRQVQTVCNPHIPVIRQSRRISTTSTQERVLMNAGSALTQTVVRKHLKAFLGQEGIPAILSDYDENARLLSEAKVYQGPQEIREFFAEFLDSLPEGAIERFSLRSLRIDGNIAY